MTTNIHPLRPQAEPAANRLEDSRARIRDWMSATTDERGRPAGTHSSSSSWLDLLGEIPVLGSIVVGVRAALRDSPLPAAARLAEGAANEALRPTAERHPLALVGVAMAAGALLWWAKPWRTVLRSALFAGMVSQLGSRLIAQIPFASLFDALQSVAKSPGRATPDHPHPSESQEGIRHSG
jgi:hypothetical protein